MARKLVGRRAGAKYSPTDPCLVTLPVRTRRQLEQLTPGTVVGLTGLLDNPNGMLPARFIGSAKLNDLQAYNYEFLARANGNGNAIDVVTIEDYRTRFDGSGNVKARRYGVKRFFEGESGYESRDKKLREVGI